MEGGSATVEIKVLAYNVWGMPRQFGGQQKSLRMPQIAKKLAEGCKKVRLSLFHSFSLSRFNLSTFIIVTMALPKGRIRHHPSERVVDETRPQDHKTGTGGRRRFLVN